ncbi:hypothetical protein QBZ16_004329 [Prototheca wickerhamii]|uniref:SHSP domain-containing protein n=1 Tax=Prototheca wickerhamii TaxID=3111 RepID=A0AAD9II10_PROWI|nr:hypothetical protein QBZ16_004329 [Prototheca wickerhamii]
MLQPFRYSKGSGQLARSVATDVVEDKDKFVVKADIPGVKKEDIHVTTEGDVLSFSVESKQEKKEDDKDKKYHRYERTQTFVSRSVRLPQTADLGKVKASYTDGVLSLEIPKQEEKSSSRRITVA